MENNIRPSSITKGKLYAKIHDAATNFAEDLQKIIGSEREAFGNIEISFNRSKVHVQKVTLATKPLFEIKGKSEQPGGSDAL